MLRRLYFCALICIAWATTAASEDVIHPLVMEAAKEARSGVSTHYHSPASDADGNAVVRCLVQTDNPEALKARGWFSGTHASGMATARIPADRILEASRLEGVRGLFPTMRKELHLDVGASDQRAPGTGAFLGANFDAAHTAGFTGEGVIVGVIDSGIDYTHPDFLDDATELTDAPVSRILSIWDQTLSPQGGESIPTGYAYGVEYINAEINGALANPPTATLRTQDNSGHGTHVAGIAAGDGSWSFGQYTGGAPDAQLIIVKSALFDSEIIDGVNYIFGIANALNRPCVVNLSLGSQDGSHDGKQAASLDKVLSDMTGPGRLICASMGNEREDNQHTEATVATALSLQFDQEAVATQQLVDIWHHAGDSYDVSVSGPGLGSTPVVDPGNSQAFQMTDGQHNVTIFNAGFGMIQADGDRDIIITIANSSGGSFQPLASGTWTINLERNQTSGNGAIDAWFALDSDGGAWTSPAPSSEELVGSPAGGYNVISVAAHATKTSWTDNGGAGRALSDPPALGDIATFSNPGPLRRESASSPVSLFSPDISAPGQVIASTLSVFASYSSAQILENPDYVVLQGTSMSCPHVAGALALALEGNPELTVNEVRQAFSANNGVADDDVARQDTYAVGINDDFGYGKINANALIDVTQLLGAGRWKDYAETAP